MKNFIGLLLTMVILMSVSVAAFASQISSTNEAAQAMLLSRKNLQKATQALLQNLPR